MSKKLIKIDLNKDNENDEWEVRVYHDGIYTSTVTGPRISIGEPQKERSFTKLEFKK